MAFAGMADAATAAEGMTSKGPTTTGATGTMIAGMTVAMKGPPSNLYLPLLQLLGSKDPNLPGLRPPLL